MLTSQSQYGENYYRCHCGPLPYDRSCAHWATFFGGIADTLIRSFRPARVFDAGCALGFLVEAFWDRGVEAWGRDISDFAIWRSGSTCGPSAPPDRSPTRSRAASTS